MDVVSTCLLRTGSLLWRARDGSWAQTVVCKATFQLQVLTSPLAAEQEDIYESDSHWNDDPTRSLHTATDLAPLKPHADVVVVGHAWAPAAMPVSSLIVRVVVGKIDKSIAVLGDRTSTSSGQLRGPALFTKVPLRWERAAGGPGTSNPVGVRHRVPDVHGVCPLPNFQPPDAPLGITSEPLPPLGFGPIARTWPSRTELLRRHAATWPQAFWEQPLPGDIDLRYFSHAPLDQQVEALRHDERILLENLHPEIQRFTTNLTPIEPWATLERRGGQRRLQLRCDTLCIDTDRFLCTLTWRVQISLRDPEEAGRVLIGMDRVEPARPPWSNDDWTDETVALPKNEPDEPNTTLAIKGPVRARPVLPFAPAPAITGPARSRPVLPFAPAPEPPTLPPPGAPPPKRARTGTLTPEGPSILLPFRPPKRSPTEDDTTVHSVVVDRGPALPFHRLAPAPAEVLQDDEEDPVPTPPRPQRPPPPPPPLMVLRPPEPEDLTLHLDEAPPSPPPSPARVDRAVDANASPIRAGVMARLAQGAPLSGLELTAADLSGLDFSGRSLAGLDLRRARLARAILRDADLSTALLEGADLTQADLRGAHLRGADLSGATLTRAIFDEALVDDLGARGAHGSGATFRGAKGKRALFAEGTWEDADFSGAELEAADLSNATLDGAIFEAATLARVTLDEARGRAVVLTGAQLPRAQANRARFEEAKLDGAVASASVWDKAELERCSFLRADLRGASFSEARCTGANFEGADLRDARLAGADLTQARFAKANLENARLARAKGTGADFSGAKLVACDLRRARLTGGSFADVAARDARAEESDLSEGKLTRADLRNANLRRAELKGADLSSAQLEGADLRGADLEGANLFAAVKTRTRTAGANLQAAVSRGPEGQATPKSFRVPGA